jgi:hypothetical protein
MQRLKFRTGGRDASTDAHARADHFTTEKERIPAMANVLLSLSLYLPTQIEGAAEAIKAAEARGWEAVLLVVLILAIVGFFGFILRQIIADAKDRERRLADRVTKLEDELRNELLTQVRLSTDVMSRVVAAADGMIAAANRILERMDRYDATLAARPCLLPSEVVRRLQEAMDDPKLLQS